jgi:inosose dehydratase
MRVGYHTITWGGVVGDPVGVTSVKDLFYRVNGPMDRAITEIGELGYQGVEMFDGNVADFAERPGHLRALLERAGVELVSVYTGGNYIYDEILPDELHRATRAAELARQFGASHLVVGGGAQRASGRRDEDYRRLAGALDSITDIAEAHGLTACYHPHLSTIVESPDDLDRLLPHTRIGFCPDTAHLVAGGGDPAQLIRQYADRVHHVHLKDVRVDPFEFLPLGRGQVDFTDVLAALRECGYDGWLMVELDSYAGDPREAAAMSKTFLDGLLATSGDSDVTHPTGESR